MTRVGIIVNPASGHDIRRLISAATVVDNSETLDRTLLFMPLSTHGIRIPIIAPAKNCPILRVSSALASGFSSRTFCSKMERR